MPLGWIDFSKSERNKVLSVLDRLSEKDTLDELGIAPIRDGFANIFFPGTSTIQTRAKYFMIVPYALKDLELSDESNPNKVLQVFDEVEKSCGKQFLVNGDDLDGIIGSRSLNQGVWVKRTPADIYWAGLRNYGIFTGGTLTLSEYVRAVCALKKQKTTIKNLGNKNDNSDDRESDDKDAGDLTRIQFWNIPTYTEKWMDDLDIKLTESEGEFLKHQIMISFPDSMMAYILKNKMVDLLEVEEFAFLENLIHLFPSQVQTDYFLAKDLGKFTIVTDEFEEWNINQAIAIFRAKEHILPRFLLHALMQPTVLEPFIGQAVGIRQQNLSLEQCRNLQFPLPSLEEQKAFVEFSEQLNKSRFAVQKSLDEAKLLFDSLMQVYFG